MSRTIIITLITVSLLGCVDSGRPKSGNKESILENGILIGYADFKLIGALSKENNIDKIPESKRELFADCRNWTFKEASIKNLLNEMKQVDPSYAYQLCEFYPCWYTGKVTNGKVLYEITIYAHSAVTLTNKKESLFFIMERESDLFITPCTYIDE